MSRRVLSWTILGLTLILLTNQALAETTGQTYSPLEIRWGIYRGCVFLSSLYSPVIQLVRETPNSSRYWIASDNLLVENLVIPCLANNLALGFDWSAFHFGTEDKINQSIQSCCENGYNHMHEALLDVQIQFPISYATVKVVANSTAGVLFRDISPALAGGNYTVLWETHDISGTGPDPFSYGDIAAYTALEVNREGCNPQRGDICQPGVSRFIGVLNEMYDGRGIVDEPYKNGRAGELGVYQTFKDALYLMALLKTNQFIPDTLVPNILRMQGLDGGFHTGYDQAGTYAGTLENAETTSMVILALAALLPPLQSISIPLTGLVYNVALVTAITAIMILVLRTIARRKRQDLNKVGMA